MEKRRLGLFLFYDAEGIVDDYVLYLLNDLRRVLTNLIVIVNGSVQDVGRERLSRISDTLVVRENRGFDAGAWKEAIVTVCGEEKLRTFDEVVLANDSFFGPFIPFQTIFTRMEARGVDFWGLSVHGEAPGPRCPYGYRPRYLQTYFLVFGGRMIQSGDFFRYWQHFPEITDRSELSDRSCAVLTRHFEDLGYRWAVFSDTSDLESPDRKKNFDHHSFAIYELLSKRDYPILKRRSFLIPRRLGLRFNDGFDFQKALTFIWNTYGYDPKLIYDHLLRKYNTADLKEILNLNFVLPGRSFIEKTDFAAKRVAVFAHLYYADLIEDSAVYLRNIPAQIDLIITTDSEKKADEIRSLVRSDATIRVVPSRGRELSALLVGCRDLIPRYDFVCFIHDKKSSQKEFRSVGKAFSDSIWDATLHSTEYIQNVLVTFEDNPRLGLLAPPPPFWGTYFWSSVDYWTICHDEVMALGKRLNLDAKMERDKRLIAIGSVFWCRREALDPLFKAGLTLEDFPPEPVPNDGTFLHAIERIFQFVAASQRYLTGWVMSDEYARVLISDYQVMFDETKSKLKEYSDVRTNTFDDYLESIRKIPLWKRIIRKLKDHIRRICPDWFVKMYRKLRFNDD